MCPRLERGTLDMEVGETQSYTEVVEYTYMNGAAHWGKTQYGLCTDYSQYGKERKGRVFI